MVKIGSMRFAGQFSAPLPEGSYTLRVTQQAPVSAGQVQDAQFTFRCTAEPLCLQPEDVYSVYPPRGSYGKFDLVLPHVVFTRRTLPWERTVFPGEPHPWLALLLYDETEGAVPQALPAAQAFAPAPRVYCPVADRGDPDETCIVLDVPADLFCDTFITEQDLKLTAHARGVSRENKVTEAAVIDEWLSVLIATRYPASSTAETGVKNTAYVVSCEAFGAFLRDGALRERIRSRGEYDYVRIPVLASWDFYSYQADFDFKTLFLSLDAAPFALPDNPALDPELRNLLSMGYAPVDHLLRDGSNTVSWYRGPLLPCARPPEANETQYFSDARLLYDPELGMFDISNSTAFNLGRQLALQSESYAAALSSWRNANKRDASSRLQTRGVSRRLPADSASPCGINDQILSIIEEAANGLLEMGNGDE